MSNGFTSDFLSVPAEIIQGDCLKVMSQMADNSIDFIVTDPPYGLKFMGKDWDRGIPGTAFWKEAIRICKSGSMLAAFGGTRTHHRLMCAIEDARWEIRDCIFWCFGQGFPKSHNFGKQMQNEAWKGYGTALKPAYEPIIIAMKPLEGTFKENAEKWGVAGINIDASRVGTGEDKGEWPLTGRENTKDIYGDKRSVLTDKNAGRWPANLIFDEEAGQMLDDQSGNLKGNCGIKGIMKGARHNGQFGGGGLSGDREYNFEGYNDSGGASRFFYCAKTSTAERNRGLEGMPLKQSNPNFGSGGFSRPTDQPERETQPVANHHPTVKPIALMKYIIKLLAPPGNPVLLDPFCGSGSTLLAAQQLGIKSIGIELESEYCQIAERRLRNA